MDLFFGLPLEEKKRGERKFGESGGYASSFTGRFASKLPWKETISFRYCDEEKNIVGDYLLRTMGEDFRQFGYEIKHGEG